MGVRQTAPLGSDAHHEGGGPPRHLVDSGPLGAAVWRQATARSNQRHRDHHSAKTARPAGGENAAKAKPGEFTPEEEAFLERFRTAQIRSRGGPGKAIVGLPPEQLAPVFADGKRTFYMHTDVAPAFIRMWTAINAEAENVTPEIKVGIVSTYRDSAEDERAWRHAVRKYLARTKEAREESGEEYGDKALSIFYAEANGKKAPPGFSGHTHGIAADLTTTENQHQWTVNSDPDHQVGWQGTWLYKWLVDNAVRFGFFQLKTETWHWEYHSGKPSRQCYVGDAPIGARHVKGGHRR